MRKILAIIFAILVALVALPVSVQANILNPHTKLASGSLQMTVYRSPLCSCCGGWIDYLKQQGFQINDIKTEEIEAIKQKYQVPDSLTSCHTALIDGYVIEGHVPADDIKRVLAQKPDVVGLTVPQMPVGTPGMEMGGRKDPFSVLAFKKNGEVQVFKHYPN